MLVFPEYTTLVRDSRVTAARGAFRRLTRATPTKVATALPNVPTTTKAAGGKGVEDGEKERQKCVCALKDRKKASKTSAPSHRRCWSFFFLHWQLVCAIVGRRVHVCVGSARSKEAELRPMRQTTFKRQSENTNYSKDVDSVRGSCCCCCCCFQLKIFCVQISTGDKSSPSARPK